MMNSYKQKFIKFIDSVFNIKNIFCVLLLNLSIFFCFALFACSNVQNPLTINEKNTIIDMKKREINIPKNVNRAVILSAAEAEIAYDLDVSERIVALGEMCNYPKDICEKNKIQCGVNLNIEQILQLKPDVVITNIMGVTIEQINSIEQQNIPVVAIEATDINGIFQSINLIANVFNSQDKGNELVCNLQDKINKYENLARLQPFKKSIYIEISPLQYGLWSGGSGTYINDICNILKLTNICEGLGGWSTLGQEFVIDKNPDIIIAAANINMAAEDYVDEIKSRAGWLNIKAVQNDNIFIMETSMIQRPSTRIADSIEEIYNLVYEK